MPGGRQKATEVAVWEDAATAEQEGAVGGEWVLLPQAMAGESGGETGGRLARGVLQGHVGLTTLADTWRQRRRLYMRPSMRSTRRTTTWMRIST